MRVTSVKCPRPVIQSVRPPPDKHAQRIVGEMLSFLHGEKVRPDARTQGVIDAGQMDTPVGQHRVTERLRKLTVRRRC